MANSNAPFPEAIYQAFDISPIGVVIGDAENCIVWPNRAFCRLLGREREALIGMSVAEVAADGLQQPNQERMQAILRGELQSHTFAMRFLHADGSIRVTETQLTLLPNAHGDRRLLVAHVIDHTVRDKLERAADRSSRMRTVGRMAGAIAHDFNNLLTAITANASLLRMDVQGEDLESVDDIIAASEAGARLTSQLLTFSKGGVSLTECLDLAGLVRELGPTLRSLCPSSVQIHCEIEPGAWMIGDPSQLEQVMLNLITNAVHAIDGDGQITVTVKPDVDETILKVQDSGRGMSQDVADQAFEPYFTTRRLEGGSGLGLTTVYGVVDRFGGEIGVESELRQGTTFTVRWPRVAAPAPAAREELPEAPPDLGGGRPAILVVDDDRAVRRVVVRALAGAGFRLFKADSVAEGQALFAKHSADIHMLLTDVVLGDGNGYELAMSLRDQRPNLPILYMSGYARDVLEPYAEGQLSPLLEKPFTAEQVIASVQAMFPDY